MKRKKVSIEVPHPQHTVDIRSGRHNILCLLSCASDFLPERHLWFIGKVQLTAGGNTLEIRGLNEDTVAADVAASVISGDNFHFEGTNNVVLDDDVADLWAYIIAHPNSFNTTADMILTKVP